MIPPCAIVYLAQHGLFGTGVWRGFGFLTVCFCSACDIFLGVAVLFFVILPLVYRYTAVISGLDWPYPRLEGEQ